LAGEEQIASALIGNHLLSPEFSRMRNACRLDSLTADVRTF
jgi:hypothetical protein